MSRRTLTFLALATGLVLGAACSEGGRDDEALPEAHPAGDTDTDGGASDSGDDGADREATPQGQTLDLEMRTPGGVTLTVSRLSFEDGDIFVDAGVVNSSSDDVTFHGGNDGALRSKRLRLVDDAGNEYDFVEATYDESSPFLGTGGIDLAPGESIRGTFAFRGPLSGEPGRISLVTNVHAADIDGFDLDSQTAGPYPEFVVPFDLVWE
jgi:hypothetical protein